jgi:hypothetical protein
MELGPPLVHKLQSGTRQIETTFNIKYYKPPALTAPGRQDFGLHDATAL